MIKEKKSDESKAGKRVGGKLRDGAKEIEV